MADAAVEAAPGDENDDNWLYGDSANDQVEGGAPDINDKVEQQPRTDDGAADAEDKEQEEVEGGEGEGNDDSHFNDAHFGEVERDNEEPANGDADSQDNGDSDSDDSDDIKVTIGEIKSGPQAYTGMNIKRGVGLVASGDKPRPGPAAGSKVTMEDLDGPGSINGVPALEFNIDTIEDKPWNKPGADISDYFNYGFNEVTWSAYCDRQRRMRVSEAGVTMHTPQTRAPPPEPRRPQGPPITRHDDMPPGVQNNYQARENTIQVMTAERREYGRTHVRDAPPPDYFSAPPPEHAYYPPPHAPYEESWAHPEQNNWAPTEIKELTPGPMGPPMGPPMTMAPPVGPPHPIPPVHVMGPSYAPPYRSHLPPHLHERERDRERDRDRDRERDRDRDRERDRDRLRERDERERRDRDRREEEERDRDRERSRSSKPDRIREKSYRRERSRSRSRRHKSRSRSPRQRERSRERDRSRDRERSTKPKNKEPKDKDEEK